MTGSEKRKANQKSSVSKNKTAAEKRRKIIKKILSTSGNNSDVPF